MQTEARLKFFPATSMPDRDWWAVLWPDPEGVLRSIGVRPDMTVLDLCCGDGYFTAPMAKITNGRRAADARQVAHLIPELVDYVLIANTFHGVPDQPGLAAAVASVLDKGGLFGIVNWHSLPREQTVVLGEPRGPKTEMRMSPDAVQAMVEPAGFRLSRMIDLPPYHYGAIFERNI